jgi:hypothetical protein
MLRKVNNLFCLSCGLELPEPLRRTASLRCHECRDAGSPISFEHALRAREICRGEAMKDLEDVLRARGTAV